ncbi:unnamed protein product [Lampetra planeri]
MRETATEVAAKADAFKRAIAVEKRSNEIRLTKQGCDGDDLELGTAAVAYACGPALCRRGGLLESSQQSAQCSHHVVRDACRVRPVVSVRVGRQVLAMPAAMSSAAHATTVMNDGNCLRAERDGIRVDVHPIEEM